MNKETALLKAAEAIAEQQSFALKSKLSLGLC